MQESSAATQITPGAIERNRSGSAPMPSGNRLVTITKNSSAARLALRRPARGNPVARQSESVEGMLDGAGRNCEPGEPAGNRQILRRGEVVLHCRGVADVDELLRVFLAQTPDRRALPAHFAAGGGQQPAPTAQQAGLAATVGPGKPQQLAAAQRERQCAEKYPPAARAL